MNVEIYSWSRESCKSKLEPIGLHDRQILEALDENAFKDLVAKVFATGLNVMLHHGKDDNVTLFIDYRRFQIR